MVESIRDKFEKETGWYPSSNLDRTQSRYKDDYIKWLENAIKNNKTFDIFLEKSDLKNSELLSKIEEGKTVKVWNSNKSGILWERIFKKNDGKYISILFSPGFFGNNIIEYESLKKFENKLLEYSSEFKYKIK